MERVEFVVRGEDAWTAPQAIKGYPKHKRVDYDGDGFAVIVTEQYYFRTNSTLQVTTVFELVGDDACEVTFIAGGGGSGLLQSDLGSEAAESTRLVEKLRTYCESNGLDLERR